ncbi:nucleotide-binding protein [candidate division WOR-3 bacterium]|nr:nucleotide-binding protein [candidate division WOR-3 bacterium]
MNEFTQRLRLIIFPYLKSVLDHLKRKLSIDSYQKVAWAEYWEDHLKKTKDYFLELKKNLQDLFEALSIRELPEKLSSEEGPFFEISYIEFFRGDLELAIRLIRNYLEELTVKAKADIAKVFISHGPPTSVLDRVFKFVRDDLGLEPIVAEWTASEGRGIRPDAEKKIQESHCAIILAEKDPDDPKGKNPRGNVLIESEHAKLMLKDKLIWLKEEGVEWPSMNRAIIWESFTQDCLEKAFAKIVRELRAFDLLR